MANIKILNAREPLCAGQLFVKWLPQGETKPVILELRISSSVGTFLFRMTEEEWKYIISERDAHAEIEKPTSIPTV